MTKQELIEAMQPFPDDAEVIVAHFFRNGAVVSDISSVCANGPAIQLNITEDENRFELGALNWKKR